MHIHILGICGTFMGGIAAIARQAGYRVTGCDANVYPPMSTQLEAQGIELIDGFGVEQLDLKPDIFVIGNVVTRGNPLMEEILNRNLPYISGPQWLAQTILRDKWVLAVAGTHGKTTTSSMLAWILEHAGLNPGFLIGGVPQNFGVSARLNPPSPPFTKGGISGVVMDVNSGDSHCHTASTSSEQAFAKEGTIPPFTKGGISSVVMDVNSGDSHCHTASTSPEQAFAKEGAIAPLSLVSPPFAKGGQGGISYFVIEADEYDTAFFDKRSKFVHYHPRTVVLNNLEFDHADIFADLAAIETQFHHLVRTVPGNGLVVCNGCEESLRRVLRRGCWTPVESFGSSLTIPPAGEVAADWRIDDDCVTLNGTPQGTLQWDLLGEHNRMNALAALAAARHAGVPVAQGLAALSVFRSVKRRMEVRGIIDGITVYDDFAHHPTAIAATIAGLRRNVGDARILAVLEPRSNTMKLGIMKDALPGSLANADLVFCYTGNLGWDARGALSQLGDKAAAIEDLCDLVEAIAAVARSGDHVLVMSNGEFGGIHDRLLKRIDSRLR